MAVYVNDVKTGGIDPQTLAIDISDLVKPGKNEIRMDVSTPLNNRMVQRQYAIYMINGIQPIDSGITGEVKVRTYTLCAIAGDPIMTTGVPRITTGDDPMIDSNRPDDAHYRVNMSVGEGGVVVNGVDAVFKLDQVIHVEVAAKEGYRFAGWTSSMGTQIFADPSSPSTTFTMPAETLYITGNFVKE